MGRLQLFVLEAALASPGSPWGELALHLEGLSGPLSQGLP